MLFVQARQAPEDHQPPTDSQPVRSDAVFEALIVPHRSLSGRGILILITAIGVSSSLISLRFWFLGAWPVIAFSGAEVLLAVVLLAINRRHARAREVIKLNATEIIVVQTDHYGRRRSFSLPSAWLQIKLESIGDHGTRLLLRSHGRGREVGALLHAPEKQSLFEALQQALHDMRQPRFDNKQLRD